MLRALIIILALNGKLSLIATFSEFKISASVRNICHTTNDHNLLFSAIAHSMLTWVSCQEFTKAFQSYKNSLKAS